MRYVEILREYNEARLINDFGKKLLDHYENDLTGAGWSEEIYQLSLAFKKQKDLANDGYCNNSFC